MKFFFSTSNERYRFRVQLYSCILNLEPLGVCSNSKCKGIGVRNLKTSSRKKRRENLRDHFQGNHKHNGKEISCCPWEHIRSCWVLLAKIGIEQRLFWHGIAIQVNHVCWDVGHGKPRESTVKPSWPISLVRLTNLGLQVRLSPRNLWSVSGQRKGSVFFQAAHSKFFQQQHLLSTHWRALRSKAWAHINCLLSCFQEFKWVEQSIFHQCREKVHRNKLASINWSVRRGRGCGRHCSSCHMISTWHSFRPCCLQDLCKREVKNQSFWPRGGSGTKLHKKEKDI